MNSDILEKTSRDLRSSDISSTVRPDLKASNADPLRAELKRAVAKLDEIKRLECLQNAGPSPSLKRPSGS